MKNVLKVICWGLSIALAFISVAAFVSDGGFVAGIFFLLAAAITNPKVASLMRINKRRIKKAALIPSAIVAFFIGCVAFPTTNTEESNVVEGAKQEASIVSVADADAQSTGILDDAEYMDRSIEVPDDDMSYFSDEVEQESLEDEINDPGPIELDLTEQDALVMEQPEQESESSKYIETEQSDNVQLEEETEQQNSQDETDQNSDKGGGSYNFDKYDIPEQQNTEDQWVLNISTMKIHYPKCKDVKKIKPENYATSNLSLDELFDQGYTRCGHCFKK